MLRKCFAVGIFAVMMASAADTRVADAAQLGDREAVRALLTQKVDVNAAQGDGSTALHWAAVKDDVELAKMLLAAGANVKATTRNGVATPLFMACKNGNSAMIDVLLKGGSDPDATDEHGTTPLMIAAASGKADAVKMLVDHGANVNAKEGAHGQTALMFAAALDRVAAIQILAAHGADVSITSKAVKLAKIPSSFEDQVKGPAETSTPKQTPADQDKAALGALAAGMGLKSAIYEADTHAPQNSAAQLQALAAKIEALEKKLPAAPKLEEDARPVRERGASEMGGMTALLFAARDGHIDAARALIEAGADVNQVSPSDKTSPLVMAVANGHFDMARFFVDYGANPNLATTSA